MLTEKQYKKMQEQELARWVRMIGDYPDWYSRIGSTLKDDHEHIWSLKPSKGRTNKKWLHILAFMGWCWCAEAFEASGSGKSQVVYRLPKPKKSRAKG